MSDSAAELPVEKHSEDLNSNVSESATNPLLASDLERPKKQEDVVEQTDENDATSEGNETQEQANDNDSGQSVSKPPAGGRPAVKKDSLRKGKWTPEEEKYTNKVIEVFNAGLLKLGENERGITLRAYLADKLQCDPMRITKKYTGAACLGKRVYHFDYQHAENLEAERLRQELQVLENNFKLKLEQINRKKSNEPAGFDDSYRISTPAIDALLKQSGANQQSSSSINNSENRPSFPPFAGYPPHLFAQSSPGYMPPHPHFFPMQQAVFGHPMNIPGHDEVVGQHDSNGSTMPSVSASLPTLSQDKKTIPPHPTAMMPQFIRGPNGELYVHPSYAASFSPYYMAMPPPYLAALKDDVMHRMPPYPLPYSAIHGLPTGMGAHPGGPTWKEIHAAAQLNPIVSQLPNLGLSLPQQPTMMVPPIPVVDVASLEPKNKRPRRNSSSSKLDATAAPTGAPEKKDSSEEEMLNRKIELSEVDQNEAATSLLGFINHVKRNGSQEDLAEFFEGVHQKSVGGSIKSPTTAESAGLGIQKSTSYGIDLSKLDSKSTS